MIDQYKMYNYINWIIFSLYVALAIIICELTSIEINQYGLIAIENMSKYLRNIFPLIITYPFIHFVNEHYYESGAYRRFIKRRIRGEKDKS